MKKFITLAVAMLSVSGLQAGYNNNNNQYNNNNQSNRYNATATNQIDDSQYSAAADLTQTDTDHSTAQSIQSAVAQDPAVSHNAKMTVQVTVRNGTVTLTGNVANEAEKSKIGTIARGISGVTNVDNQLSIGK